MGMFMGFSPVECVVSYVGSVDRYTLFHSYIWLPGQDSNRSAAYLTLPR